MTGEKTVVGDELQITPITVTIPTPLMGTGGGVPLQNGQVLRTPDSQPNIKVRAVSLGMTVLVRFANAYLGSLTTAMTIEVTAHGMAAGAFWKLLVTSGSFALAGPALLALKDVTTLLTAWEKDHPLLTGNV